MAVRAIALVSTCLLLWQVSAAQGSTSRSAKGANTTSTRDPAAPSPVHYESMTGSRLVSQKPGIKPIKGTLLVLHGCGQSATDFFRPQPGCATNCAGLPEESNITSTALSHGYAVLAISSLNREHKCWRPLGQSRGEESHDMTQVRQVLKTWLWRERLDASPVYALGISSGGSFAMALAQRVPLAGVCVQISGLPVPVLRGLMARMPEGQLYPPTMFVHMPRDEVYAKLVARNHAVLSSEGVPVTVVEVPPRPITQQLLASKLPDLTAQQAALLVAALRSAGLIDQEGFVLADPAESREAWQQVVRTVLQLDNGGSLGTGVALTDEDQVEAARAAVRLEAAGKVLGLAYGRHEAISEATGQMIRWFEESQRTARVRRRRRQLAQPGQSRRLLGSQ